MKKIVLDYSSELLDFCKLEDLTFRISIYNDNKFLIIEFEDSQDSFQVFELGMKFTEYKNSKKY